jgi:glutaredoxin-related protein
VQVFFNGEFVGGSDILMEMHKSGDLEKMVDELQEK